MKRSLAPLLLLLPGLAAAQTQPFLHARLVPGNHVIVGQPLRLEVEVFVPNYFTGAPDYPPFEMDGAIVTLSEDRPEHLNEQKNGITYAGIRRFYLIYPEQPGKFSIPTIQVTARYSATPPATSEAALHLPPLSFVAALPAAAQDLDYFLPTSRLTIRQDWSGPLTHLHAGDSISRTVIITAQKMQAMLIPPVTFSAPDGVRVYTKNPIVENKKSPIGEFLAGVRTESTSYVFTQAGDYRLPAIEITWWDLNSQKPETSQLPEANIQVDAAGGYTSELPPQAEPPAPAKPQTQGVREYLPLLSKTGIALVLLTAAILSLRRWGLLILQRLRGLRDHWRDSEPAHWRRLKQALAHNDAARSYAFLLVWLRRSHAGTSLAEFQQMANDPRLDEQILALARTLYAGGKGEDWNGRSLLSTLAAHRKATTTRRLVRAHLPPLNPI
jgi:hypothetical protein